MVHLHRDRDEVIVSTCFDFDYDTGLNVYEGTCDGLVCVDGNDDVAGSPAHP